MKYFFDTEFIEDGKTIDLISIGIVAEDGREFYVLNRDCEWSKASDWVKENVLAHLPEFPDNSIPTYAVDGPWLPYSQISEAILYFVNRDSSNSKPEFWAYYADYDWVVFCQLFGTMMDLPDGFPMYCRDLKQDADRLGIDLSAKVPQENEHHALADARWNAKAYNFLAKCPGFFPPLE